MPADIPRWRPTRPSVKPSKERAHYLTDDWAAKREAVLVRDAYTCRVCRRVVYGKHAHVDHILPLEDGGTDDLLNLQVLCDEDHGRKTRDEQRRKGHLSP